MNEYTSEILAEAAWQSQSSRPGKKPISRMHYAFNKGVEAYHEGQTECPYLPGGEADRHWRSGWNDAANQVGGARWWREF